MDTCKLGSLALLEPEERVVFRLKREIMVIGTDPDCDIVIADPRAAGRTCQVSWVRPGAYQIVHLKAGTRPHVNGEPVGEHPVNIKLGDEITIGKVRFVVSRKQHPIKTAVCWCLAKLGLH